MIEFIKTDDCWFFVGRGSVSLGRIKRSHDNGPLFNGITADELEQILSKMKELQNGMTSMDEINKMIDDACPVNGGGDYTQMIVNPDALKKLLTLLATRDESLMRKIEELEGENNGG